MPYQCYHKICINSIYYIARSAGLQVVFDVNLLLLKGKVLEMEKQYKVGIVGATGMVGQRFVTCLRSLLVQADHAGRVRPQRRQDL